MTIKSIIARLDAQTCCAIALAADAGGRFNVAIIARYAARHGGFRRDLARMIAAGEVVLPC
jgi:hypothetical protein